MAQAYSAFFYGTLMHPSILRRVIGHEGADLLICPAILLVSCYCSSSDCSAAIFELAILMRVYTRNIQGTTSKYSQLISDIRLSAHAGIAFGLPRRDPVWQVYSTIRMRTAAGGKDCARHLGKRSQRRRYCSTRCIRRQCAYPPRCPRILTHEKRRNTRGR